MLQGHPIWLKTFPHGVDAEDHLRECFKRLSQNLLAFAIITSDAMNSGRIHGRTWLLTRHVGWAAAGVLNA
jgi:hypothetical protein